MSDKENRKIDKPRPGPDVNKAYVAQKPPVPRRPAPPSPSPPPEKK
jgi:hypothetical protein